AIGRAARLRNLEQHPRVAPGDRSGSHRDSDGTDQMACTRTGVTDLVRRMLNKPSILYHARCECWGLAWGDRSVRSANQLMMTSMAAAPLAWTLPMAHPGVPAASKPASNRSAASGATTISRPPEV